MNAGITTSRNDMRTEEELKPMVDRDGNPVVGGSMGSYVMLMNITQGGSSNHANVRDAVTRVLTTMPENVRRTLMSEYYGYEQRMRQSNDSRVANGEKPNEIMDVNSWVAQKANNIMNMYKQSESEYKEGAIQDEFGYGDRVVEKYKEQYWRDIMNPKRNIDDDRSTRHVVNQVRYDPTTKKNVVIPTAAYSTQHNPGAVNSLAESYGVKQYQGIELTETNTAGAQRMSGAAPYVVLANGSMVSDPRILNTLRITGVGGDVITMPKYDQDPNNPGRYDMTFNGVASVDQRTGQPFTTDSGDIIYSSDNIVYQRMIVTSTRNEIDEIWEESAGQGQIFRPDIVNSDGSIAGNKDLTARVTDRVDHGFYDQMGMRASGGSHGDRVYTFEVLMPLPPSMRMENVEVGQQGTTGNADVVMADYDMQQEGYQNAAASAASTQLLQERYAINHVSYTQLTSPTSYPTYISGVAV